MSEVWTEIVREYRKPIVRFLCVQCYERVKIHDIKPAVILVMYTVCDICRKETLETVVVVVYP